jgi:two-component system response regulator RegX3
VSPAILIADDDPGIRDVVTYALKNEGLDVEAVPDGETALERARAETFDVVILDVMMPGISGIDACRALRAESSVPIVMLTAKDAEVDRVLGLELGADDYVTKPFSMAELVSRIRALLRRRELDLAEGGSATRQVGGLRLDLGRHEASVDGRPVHLTLSEFKVLALLAERPEQVFTRRQVMQHLWQSEYVGDEHACDVHISNLRRKIEEDAGRPRRLVTVRGVGYKLLPVESVSSS